MVLFCRGLQGNWDSADAGLFAPQSGGDENEDFHIGHHGLSRCTIAGKMSRSVCFSVLELDPFFDTRSFSTFSYFAFIQIS